MMTISGSVAAVSLLLVDIGYYYVFVVFLYVEFY